MCAPAPAMAASTCQRHYSRCSFRRFSEQSDKMATGMKDSIQERNRRTTSAIRLPSQGPTSFTARP